MERAPEPRFMRQAIRLALRGVATSQGGPFGAVIVREGVVLGRGFNRVLATNDPTAHAEVVAIRQATRKLADFSLAGAELYTSCEPCPMCLAACQWARIERVWYACDRHDAARAGFDDALFYDELARAPAERRMRQRELLRDEGAATFAAWRAKVDRAPY